VHNLCNPECNLAIHDALVLCFISKVRVAAGFTLCNVPVVMSVLNCSLVTIIADLVSHLTPFTLD